MLIEFCRPDDDLIKTNCGSFFFYFLLIAGSVFIDDRVELCYKALIVLLKFTHHGTRLIDMPYLKKKE